jgi:hypothetical protein
MSIIHIRYRENGNWGAWSAITVGYLRSSAVFGTNTWQTSSDSEQ